MERLASVPALQSQFILTCSCDKQSIRLSTGCRKWADSQTHNKKPEGQMTFR